MRFGLLAILLLAAVALAQPTQPADLRTYAARDYVIHTNLGREAAREAELRLTRMAEEYRRRTREFAGRATEKLPFYLYRSEAEYHAAGGTPNTAGEYDPNTQTLKAWAGEDGPNLVTWHTVQHEGFHQFADQAIGRGLPIWVSEGLAEYFAEALFTGDAFVPGIIPPWRLKRVQQSIEASDFIPLRELLQLSHREWNNRLGTTNYDQVWSLVHYLVHGDDGAHREPLTAFLRDVAAGDADALRAVERHFDVDALEKKWRAWWTALPEDPTRNLYAEATLRTLTSFLARATARRQRFASFEPFLRAAERRELKAMSSDWLPPSLLKVAVARVAELEKAGGSFRLITDAPQPPRIVYAAPDGEEMVGRFTLKGFRVEEVVVDRPPAPSPAAPADG